MPYHIAPVSARSLSQAHFGTLLYHQPAKIKSKELLRISRRNANHSGVGNLRQQKPSAHVGDVI
jgi:hypothetical protein